MLCAEIQRFSVRAAAFAVFVALSGLSWADGEYRAELASIDRLVEEAVVRGDLERLRQLYMEDFRFTHFTGEMQTRAQWLADVAERPFARRIVSEVQVEPHGNAALTTGRIAVTERVPPNRRYALRYVRLYVLAEGHWHLASHRTIEMREEQQ